MTSIWGTVILKYLWNIQERYLKGNLGVSVWNLEKVLDWRCRLGVLSLVEISEAGHPSQIVRGGQGESEE